MSGNPFFQDVDPSSAPSPITPSDSASSPSNYAGVTPHGRGPAPYDIQAPLMDGEITAQFNEANSVGGAGVLYGQGPRQAEAQVLLESPQGFGVDGYDIDAGYHGVIPGDAGWPADVEPVHDGP